MAEQIPQEQTVANPATTNKAIPEDEISMAERSLEKALTQATGQVSIDTPNSGIATRIEVNKVIHAIAESKKVTKNSENYASIVVGVSILCQQGATSPKCSQNKSTKIGGIEIRVSDIVTACKSNNITVRKLARAMASYIIKVAERYNLEGNLSKSFKLENPEYLNQDLIWVSDFQTFSEDPAMPPFVKQWLLSNFNKRFKVSQQKN